MRLAAARSSLAALAAVATLALAACAEPPPLAGQPAVGASAGMSSGQVLAAREAASAHPGCVIRNHSGMVRPGDNVPIGMVVRNDATWCFTGFRFSGTSPAGSRIVEPAEHGEVRLLLRGGGIVFAYRPTPGYAGPDGFLITMPSGAGYDFNLAITVRVTPAA